MDNETRINELRSRSNRTQTEDDELSRLTRSDGRNPDGRFPDGRNPDGTVPGDLDDQGLIQRAQDSGRSVVDQLAAEKKDLLERGKRDAPPFVKGPNATLPGDYRKDGSVPGRSGG